MSASDPVPTSPAPQIPRVGVQRSFSSMRSILALILREMSTRYGRSPGGYVWALVEPIGSIVVLGFGLSLLLRVPALGTSFLMFFATGLMPFNLYQSVSTAVARSLNFSKPLLAYPTVTWVDALLARFILNGLTGIVVSVLTLVMIMTVTDSHVLVDVPMAVEALALGLFIGLGIGVLNCALMGLVQIWDIAWSMITRPLFFASGIFYLYEDLPRVARDILWYNPLLHVVGMMRAAFYPTYSPEYVSPLYVGGVSLITLTLGMLLLFRYHLDILTK